VPTDVLLSWDPGYGATSHDVYFGTDRDAVANANPGSPEYKGRLVFDTDVFNPAGLALGTAYYWKIDEVVLTVEEIWRVAEGDVWCFTTADDTPSIVDDFESYNNLPADDPNSNRIFETWIDGYGYGDVELSYPGNGTGSMVDISTDVIRGGAQSMRFTYNNSGRFVYYSETERAFDVPQDWTKEGVAELSLWFHGDSTNDPEPMYVALANSTGTLAVVYHDNLDAVRIDTWTEWFIPLMRFADQDVNLTNVRKMYIGVGDRDNPQLGGTGTVYFDGIRLYPPSLEPQPN
jgi:hypothetical protein